MLLLDFSLGAETVIFIDLEEREIELPFESLTPFGVTVIVAEPVFKAFSVIVYELFSIHALSY